MITAMLLFAALIAILAICRPMADLTANTPRSGFAAPDAEIEWDMNANSQLFAGSAIMMDASTGLAANCTPTASGVFLGIAKEGKDNRTGSPYGGTARSTTIKLEQKGKAWLTVARAASQFVATDVGTTVYASDGNTFTTSAGTNNIVVGKIAYVPLAAVGAASAELMVAFEATALRSI